MAMRSMIVLVDPDGAVCGDAGKLEAHAGPGRLHLAFSVFLYRGDGELLLQRRAASKYHFPMFWANACCSHPGPGEELVAAAERRVLEELGIRARLRDVGTFTYRATCPASGLVEHEFDHVLIGYTDEVPQPDPDEVDSTAWHRADEVRAGLPRGEHAPWLGPAMEIAEAARIADGR